jgi:hypothetical protein
MGGARFINLFGSIKGILLSATSFLANAAQGTAIGGLSVAGGSGTYTFTLTNSAGGAVQVAGANGQNLQVGAVASAAGSFSISVHATNGAGSTFDKSFLITATSAANNGPMDFSVPGNIAATAAL